MIHIDEIEARLRDGRRVHVEPRICWHELLVCAAVAALIGFGLAVTL